MSGNDSNNDDDYGSPRIAAISPRGWGRGDDKENYQENEDKSDEDIEQLQRKAYGYAMNIFAVLHYQSFAESREFYIRMCATLDALMSFAGPCESAQMVALVILQSLTNKLNAPASKKLFSVDDKTSVTWTNLVSIMQIIRIYTFHTVNWRTQYKDKKYSYSNSMKSSSGHKNEPQFSTIKAGKVTLGMKTIAESKENGSGKYKFGQETGIFVLEQARTAKNASIVPFLEHEEYGIHFLSDGSPADLTLIRTLLAFLKSLKLDTLDLDSSPNMSPEDVQFAKKMVAEYHFFESSVTLLSSLNRSFIDEQKLTWRYLSNITQRFLAADNTRQRNGIIEELSAVLDGSRVIQTIAIRPKGPSLNASMFISPSETNDDENPEGETDQGEGEGEGRPTTSGRSGNYGRTMKRSSSHKKKSIFGGNRREGSAGSGAYGPDRTPTTPAHHAYMSPQHHHTMSNISNPLTPRLPLSPHSYQDDDSTSNTSTPRDMTSNSITPRDIQVVSPSYGHNTPHISPYSPVSPYGYGEARGSGIATPFALSTPSHHAPTPLKLPATSTLSPGQFQLDGSHTPVFPASAFSPRSSPQPPPQARYMNNKHHGEGERLSQSEGRGEGEPHQLQQGEGEGYPPMQYQQQQQQQQHSRPYIPPLSQAQVLMSQQSFHQQQQLYSPPPSSSQYVPPSSQYAPPPSSQYAPPQAHKRHISMNHPLPPPAEVFEDEYEVALPSAPRPPPQAHPHPQPQAAVSPRLVSQPPPHLRQHFMRT